MTAVLVLALLLLLGALLSKVPGLNPNEVCTCLDCTDPEAEARREAIAAEIDAALLDGIKPKATPCSCPECTEWQQWREAHGGIGPEDRSPDDQCPYAPRPEAG